jgi:hypothetical protein
MAKRKQEAQYEVVDDDSADLDSDMEDGDGLEADVDPERAQAHSSKKSDKELFDDLPNGIKFKDEPADESDDEDDEDEDEDFERDDEDEDEDEDEEDEPVQRRGESKDKFQRRLMRERRLRNEAEEDARASNENYRRLEGELSEIKSLLVQNNTSAELQVKIDGLKQKEAQLRKELKEAIEAGETDKQFDINEKLSDVKADIRNTEASKEAALKNTEALQKAEKAKREALPENRHLQRWMRQHGTLYRKDPVFKAAAEAADKELARTGSVPNSEEHFEKLNRILARRFPEEFPNVKIKKKELNRRRPPVGGGDEDSAPTSKTRRKYTGDIEVKGKTARLSARHLKIMKDFGMDPDDPKDVQNFIRDNLPRKR